VALDTAGEHAAARRFHDWVAARVNERAPGLQRAVAAVGEGRRPDSADLLPCRFEADGRAPSGDGWGAFQMDGPGLWLWALEVHTRSVGGDAPLGRDVERAAILVAGYVAALWQRPSYDAWEERGAHTSTSTLAACLAGLRSAQLLGVQPGAGPDNAPAAIRGVLAERGRRVGYLPRSDADEAVDASLLWCGPALGVFEPSDRAWLATLEMVRSELLGPEGGVHRYAADTFYGGGEWPVLTSVLGLACLQIGADDAALRARRCADWVESQRTPDGGLPEQSSRHLLHPGHRAGWEARWGPVASPLSWSHAMAVLLRRALEEGRAAPVRQVAAT
jgi:GH15 family glucan-1,4-alpha-glucosidase